jgi:hypothetical protein
VVRERPDFVSVRTSFGEECLMRVVPSRFDVSLEEAGGPGSKEAPPFLISFPDNLKLAGLEVDGVEGEGLEARKYGLSSRKEGLRGP